VTFKPGQEVTIEVGYHASLLRYHHTTVTRVSDVAAWTEDGRRWRQRDGLAWGSTKIFTSDRHDRLLPRKEGMARAEAQGQEQVDKRLRADVGVHLAALTRRCPYLSARRRDETALAAARALVELLEVENAT
jgi:hypothetical protein